MRGKSSKLQPLLQWVEAEPHFDESGKLVNRATLLGICLGMGMIWKDAHLIQFTEGDHAEDTPHYIAASPWAINEYNAFGDYIGRLLHDIEASGYVSSVDLHKLFNPTEQ
jgi:hypothetical protein